jgi:hypothetical protein
MTDCGLRKVNIWPWMPMKLEHQLEKSDIGMALKRLGKEKYANRDFAKSIAVNGSNWRPFCRLLLVFCNVLPRRWHNRPAIGMRRAVGLPPNG